MTIAAALFDGLFGAGAREAEEDGVRGIVGVSMKR